MLLFILNEEAIAAETKKTRERDLNSLSLSLSYAMTRVSVYMRALVYNEVVFSLFETKTSEEKTSLFFTQNFFFCKTNRHIKKFFIFSLFTVIRDL